MGRKVTPASKNLSLGAPNNTGLLYEALGIP